MRAIPFAPVEGKQIQETDFGLGSSFASQLGLADAVAWDPSSATVANPGDKPDEAEGDTKAGNKKKNKKKKKKKKVSHLVGN